MLSLLLTVYHVADCFFGKSTFITSATTTMYLVGTKSGIASTVSGAAFLLWSRCRIGAGRHRDWSRHCGRTTSSVCVCACGSVVVASELTGRNKIPSHNKSAFVMFMNAMVFSVLEQPWRTTRRQTPRPDGIGGTAIARGYNATEEESSTLRHSPHIDPPVCSDRYNHPV